jgi:diguanylate cyclase (GGDEF)-like protein
MDRRQKRRVLTFLIFPFLLAIPFLTDDLAIRIIGIMLTVIYVGLLIFLRDSFKKENQYEDISSDLPLIDDLPKQPLDDGEGFTIVSKTTNTDLITEENYHKIGKNKRTTIKPPDLKERFEEIANEELPKEVSHDGQFAFVLQKILLIIKESYNAHTSIFFWYNKKKEKISVERFVSNSNEIEIRKFDLEDDILSKIIQKGEPELLTDIPIAAEGDVIRYYSKQQDVKSFVGVPLFYDNHLIGILAVDSKEPDQFGIETVFSLGRFVRLITILISLFDQKHSEFVSQKRLAGLLAFIQPANKYENEKELMDSIEKSLAYLINWDAFAFVYYHPVSKTFKTVKVINKTSLKFIGENLDIDISDTLVGKCISSGLPVKIDDTSLNEFKRFSKIEDVNFDGSFLAIPLIFQNQNYGVLCFESLKKNAYTKSDVEFLKGATNILAFMVYSLSTQHLFKSLLALDVETRALNEATFKERLQTDLIRAKELKLQSAIAVIKIDEFLEQESLFESNPFSKVLTMVAQLISNEMTAFSIFGRLGERLFGVYFFNANSKDVYIWAEKLRVKTARQTISVAARQTAFTVSIGVAASNMKTDHEELIYNANLALQKAVESGGNKVRNIN